MDGARSSRASAFAEMVSDASSTKFRPSCFALDWEGSFESIVAVSVQCYIYMALYFLRDTMLTTLISMLGILA